MPNAKGWGIEALGLKEAIDDFGRVDAAFSDAALRECLWPIATAIRDLAKRLVHPTNDAKAPGYLHLKEAIFAAFGHRKTATVIVGVDRKKAPHAHLVEFKHDLWRGGEKRKGLGHFIKEVKAKPYLRPAFDAVQKFQAKAIASMEIRDRIVSKLTRKRGGMLTPEQYGVYSSLVGTHGESYARWAATRKRP